MKGIRYLFFTIIKNQIKDLKNNPGKLIYIIFLGIMLVIAGLSGGHSNVMDTRSLKELFAIIFALYAAVFLLGAYKGFSSGASFYSMADVNLLFGLPVTPRRILMYGLIKQMGMSLLLGIFLIFQYSWLNMQYGLTMGGLVIVLLGYCIVVFSSQVTAMIIYSFTSCDDRRRNISKALFIALCVLVAGYLVYPLFFNRSDLLGTITARANTLFIDLIPVVGWMKAVVAGFLSGNFLPTILGLLSTVGLIVLLVMLLTYNRSDFYEDVLQATEVSFTAITAKKEGKVAEVVPKNVKVGKIGLGHGKGASSFYYKHLVENRRSRFFILDFNSLLFIIMCIVFSYFLKDAGIIPVFVFSIYILLFTTAAGRWLKELLLPYVYMVPVSPFKKLVMISCESIIKLVVECMLLFVPIGFLLQLSPLTTLICIIGRVGFGLLFMAGNILAERLFGSMGSKALILTLYFIMMIILCIPGIILGIIAGIFLPLGGDALPTALLVMTICNVGISALITFLCRNILSYAELNNR